MTTVLFSHEAFSNQAVGGVSRCMVELMRGLETTGVDWRVWAGKHGNRYLHEDRGLDHRVVCGTYGPLMGRVRDALTQERPFARYAARNRPQVVHRTYYPIIDLLPTATPRIVTMHDMHNELYDERDRPIERLRSLVKRRSLERADAIVCISQSTLNLMTEMWPHLAARSCVIPHGVRRLSDMPVPSATEQPFFVFVGGRAGQKNFAMALKALAASILEDHHLVCVGGGARSDGERQMVSEYGLLNRVRQVAASDDELAGLYQSAAAFLYPTRSEGFGMPILEAMIHNCPVVTTALTSLPEVGGDAVLYADPDDTDAWRSAIESLVIDSVLRSKMVRRGQLQALNFTWEENAQRHLNVYRQFASSATS